MLRALILIPLLTVLWLAASAQKRTHAVKTSQSPRIDGELDDEVWQNAPAATQFITNTPSFGQKASDSTTVKVLYDNTNKKTPVFTGVFQRRRGDLNPLGIAKPR